MLSKLKANQKPKVLWLGGDSQEKWEMAHDPPPLHFAGQEYTYLQRRFSLRYASMDDASHVVCIREGCAHGQGRLEVGIQNGSG